MYPIMTGKHYPTMGGNNNPAIDIAGTPPHTWGKPSTATPEGGKMRYTTTHVGKTPVPLSQTSATTGTPPHTWGKHKTTAMPYLLERYTPTHVGKTF